ncbi:MarP family serine protease [Nakamurella deserti]|uniref:MarP family serine protease n=1 Tax=Nakamurella deserti TaxID=2164074 RepID=UPI000DBE3D3B|nr:MarP family serine protease [Nakamurella deserti]
MTFFDVILVLIVVAGGVAGFRQGLLAAAYSLLGAVACALGALALAPVVVRDLDSGLARTAASMAILVVGVLIGEFIGGWAGRTLSEQITWTPAKAVDRTLGMAGQAVAVLALAWIVALPLASAPVPWLSSAIRNSTVLGAVDRVAPDGSQGITDQLRALLNSTGFPDILGPLGATPIVDVPAPDDALVADPVVAAAAPSVLKVRAVSQSCGQGSSGTGFVIGPDHVLTNAHVVGGASTVGVEVGGTLEPATVVAYDSEQDTAVLYVPGLNLPALVFDARAAAPQSDAIVLGYPLGGPFTVSAGRVRSVTELTGPDIYQSTTVRREVYLLRALVQPGNSGGPVLDADGEVIGVVFGAAIDDAETGFALTAAEVADTVAAGLTDTTEAATGACALD